jgi:formate hydrogenlyase subunit 3/multisubunit Na+/H+ antiporter MnhD subunit
MDGGKSRNPPALAVLQAVVGAGTVILICALALVPTLRVLGGGTPESIQFAWDAVHGTFHVGLDALSGIFLLPILVLSGLAAVYGANYLLPYHGKKSLGASWFYFNLFVAGMVMVVIARTAILFLVAWEIMSLSAYFLVTFEHERAEARRAGWVYLIATHLGVAFLIATFTLLGRNAGDLDFDAFQAIPALARGESGLIFLIALVGFGAKAGLVPFHVWLPEAHPAAPSHVSALMSGVMIKMGLYGLLRVVTFLGQPAPWWGLTLAAVGLVTGLVGISLASYQRDVKRVLAYSSIENMGLIALAFGVGLWGSASGRPTVALLGMMAAFLHIWNHALMKGLMFLAAGSVLHGTGSRDMEKLGGLMQRMPWTASVMMAGAVAITALPPLNGFASKWLMYLSLMQVGFAVDEPGSLLAWFSVGLLALIGGLAAITFVRLTGVVLLGSPRSEAAGQAHESSPWMVWPMLALLGLCIVAAVIPHQVAVLLSGALDELLGWPAGESMWQQALSATPLHVIGNFNAWTWLSVAGGLFMFWTWSRKVQTQGPTWGCGYVKPSERMQYTGRSFAEMAAEHLLPRFLRPHTTRQAPRGLFPATSDFGSACPDPIDAKVYEPFFQRWAARFSRLRILQQGKVNVYLVYIVLMVVLALAWVSVRAWWGPS